MLEKEDYCKHCINPRGLNVVNQTTGKDLKFYKVEEGVMCEICYEMMNSYSLPSRAYFDEEFNSFLRSSKRILFAYSGGMDSTVVLSKLLVECSRKDIDLQLFTIDTGVKGKIAMQNVKNVVRHFGLEEKHFFVDGVNQIQDNPKILSITEQSLTTLDVYRKCLEKSILPCGKICNTMIDQSYDRVMKDTGFEVMVTGGDTPKMNDERVYSLFWKKPSGITIVRGGYAFGLSKKINANYIKEREIPWINPGCGGYDTDCLVPGVFFSNGFNHQPQQEPEAVIRKYPIIIDYLAERVRFGVIDRNEGLRMLINVDISSPQSYHELMGIFGQTGL